MLTDKQEKLIEFSEVVLHQQNFKNPSNMESLEKKLRKTVHESIVQLTETVSGDELLRHLMNLDVSSWDNITEERSISKICGFPLCDNENLPRQLQKYHIDRKEQKIFEVSKERNKFCSVHCFVKSSFIKRQLDEHPLWITGLTKGRIEKVYQIEPDMNEEKTIHRQLNPLKTIDIVPSCSHLVTALNNLKITEHEESDVEKSDEEMQEDIAFTLKDDSDFINSLEQFIKQKPVHRRDGYNNYDSQTSMEDNDHMRRVQENVLSGCKTINTEEDEKLQILRNKFQTNKRPIPIIIEARPISRMKLTEVCTAESVPCDEELEQLPSIKEVLDEEIVSDDFHYIRSLFQEWWTMDTANLIVIGGRQPSGETDRILKNYMQGDFSENTNIILPNVDCLDVKRKRLRIIIESLKPTWLRMEKFINLPKSSSHHLVDILSTFRLESNNITGFDKKQAGLIVTVLWRIVIKMNPDLVKDYSEGHLTGIIDDFLVSLKIKPNLYHIFIDDIMRSFNH